MTEIDPNTAFVFGCGYLGRRVAKRLLATGWHVSALTRSRENAKALAGMGIVPILGDWTDRRVIQRIPAARRVLFSVGYDGRGGHDRHTVYVEGLRNALFAVRPESSVVYVSTTGVYHQGGNQWVDEASPTHPSREGGKAHLQAEELLWRRRPATASGRTVALRMAGLYGPGRVPRMRSVAKGETIEADPQSFLNLIHIEDAADCVIAAWEVARAERLYAVSDGTPVRRGEFYAEIARQLGVVAPQLQGEASGRSEGSKRIWNRRMRRDLLPRVAYSSYREGLRALCSPGGKP